MLPSGNLSVGTEVTNEVVIGTPDASNGNTQVTINLDRIDDGANDYPHL